MLQLSTTFGVLLQRSASINYRSLAHPVRNILTHFIPKNIKNPDLVVRLSTFSLRLEGLHTYRRSRNGFPTIESGQFEITLKKSCAYSLQLNRQVWEKLYQFFTTSIRKVVSILYTIIINPWDNNKLQRIDNNERPRAKVKISRECMSWLDLLLVIWFSYGVAVSQISLLVSVLQTRLLESVRDSEQDPW